MYVLQFCICICIEKRNLRSILIKIVENCINCDEL